MTDSQPAVAGNITDLNHLRRGATYRAITRNSIIVGEYLGIEVPHGDRSILIRRDETTESIALDEVTSIRRIAA